MPAESMCAPKVVIENQSLIQRCPNQTHNIFGSDRNLFFLSLHLSLVVSCVFVFLLFFICRAFFLCFILSLSVMHFEFPKDPYPNLLTMFRPVHLPPRYGLPDVNVTLQNMELWQQFHKDGTEMIITKTGRLVKFCIFSSVIVIITKISCVR